MGSPAIFKADRTKLLSSKGLELKDGTHIDNDGVVNFIKPDVTKWQAGSYTAATRPSGTFTATPAGLTVAKTTSLGTGSMSLLFSKAANNQQGSACVYEFDLPASPNKFQAAMLKIECDYLVDSGTFAAGSTSTDSDLIFYIEEFNGSAWSLKEPSNFKLFSNATNIVSTDGGIFQTNSDTTKIRLIAYVASTTASAFSLKADFSVSPQVSSTGAAVSDWQSYTPVVSADSGTLTNYTATGRWRQVGDSIEVEARLEFTGAVGTWAGPIFSLPSGFSFDTNKTLSSYNGFSLISDGGASFYTAVAQRKGANGFGPISPSVFTHTGTVPTRANVVDNNYPMVWAPTDTMNISFRGPIQGWSSNTRISDGFEGRDVVTTLGLSGNQTVSSNAETTLLFNTVITDTVSAYASNGVTIKTSGYYDILLVVNYDTATTASEQFAARIKIDGTTFRSDTTNPTSNGTSKAILISQYLTAGQVVTATVSSQTDSSYVVLQNVNTRLTVAKNNSSQTIAASPVVALHASGIAGADTIGTSLSLMKFTTIDTNTHRTAAYSASTGLFTAPESGFYNVAWRVLTANVTLSTSERFFTSLYKDGANYRAGSKEAGTGTSVPRVSVGAVNSVYLTAGQTLSIYATSSVATTAATGVNDSFFTVTKAGN